MPKTSDGCQKVCEILLLFELLRRRRPDLRLGQAESLLDLVGRRGLSRLLSPRKSEAFRTIDEGFLFGRRLLGRTSKRRPLDLLTDALEVAAEELPPETVATRVREEGFARSSEDLVGRLRPVQGLRGRSLP